jgi:hypothetical protein
MKVWTTALIALATMALTGCNQVEVDGTGGAGTGSTGTSSGTGTPSPAPASKVDLLLVVANNANMGSKRAILAEAGADLIGALVDPPCLDGATGQPVAAQPAGPLDACPSGSKRAFAPVLDMHVGLLSSSLGTFGASGCPDSEQGSCAGGQTNTSNNDHGHLVTRTDPCGATPPTATYQNEGFLAWDPTQKLTPPGAFDEGTLEADLASIVKGDGAMGCAYTSQNEAWYRFLVDPSPYAQIAINSSGEAVSTGIDQTLLQEREEFLRSDSLLAVMVVTDQSDASIKEYGEYPLFAQDKPLQWFGLSGFELSDKALYGVEPFYPMSRYVGALTSPTVQNAAGQMVKNPIFAVNPTEPNAAVRDPGLVFYGTITGVPWQLITRQDADGTPDLINGVDPLDPAVHGGFKTFAELSRKDSHGNTFWDDIAGDPDNDVYPLSPFMQESTVPREGTDPITGIAISPPSAPNGTNPINGHEWIVPVPTGDIEYACIFALPTPVDCTTATGDCACNLPANTDNPLCSPNPNDNGQPTLQTSDKAYPGVKNLAIAKGMGAQGIVASICPAQLTDGTQPTFGYRPAMAAFVAQMKTRLATP